MTRVAVLGSTGQLGSDMVRVLEAGERHRVFPLTHNDVECTNADAVESVLNAIVPEVVINCAAFVRVDECEDRPEEAFRVNALGVLNVARASARLEAVCLYVSTDYVFDGTKGEPYSEEDPPCPLNVYGASKLSGEFFLRNLCSKYFVVRTSGLYGLAGSSGKGGNFVETMIRLAKENGRVRVVNDQVMTPTYTLDLAHKIKELLQTDAYGLYHITNGGQCSWYDFASKIFESLGAKPDFGETTSAAFGAKARRPAYSVLSNRKLMRLGFGELRPWQSALEAYLRERQYPVSIPV